MNLKTETEIAQEVAARIRALRVAQKMTQYEISQRSGVALGTYRRFEQTGNIDFVRLIKIALILYRESDFDAIFPAISRTLARCDRETSSSGAIPAAGI